MKLDLESLGIDRNSCNFPAYIAVEGSIGVGKTTLARNLATTLNYDTLLEMPEHNPFLERFYRDPRPNALPTQLYFLFQRSRQIKEMRQRDLFNPNRVADFLLDKDPIFAEVTLEDDELDLYRMVYEQLALEAPHPDLVIYLQAPSEVLQKRIRTRGHLFERNIEPNYLVRLNEAYTSFFHSWRSSPLLIVNAAEVNLASNEQHYADLIRHMMRIRSGIHYYNPSAEH